MGVSLWSALGDLLGFSYLYYALVLWVGCLGPHVLLLVAYYWLASRRADSWLLLPMELLYGLLNPVLYLLVFQPGLFRSLSFFWLTALCWSLLIGYWGLRLVGPLLPLRHEALRVPVRILLSACIGLVLVMGLRDLGGNTMAPIPFGSTALATLLVGPLYLFPIAIAERQLRRTRGPETWAEPGTFFLPSRVARGVTALGALAVVVMCLTAFWRPSERGTRELLLAHRDDILSASAQAHVDPRLVASILFVTHREHTTPFHSALEEMAAHAWLADAGSHALISKVLDPSLGLAQIKPKTMLTALWILRASGGQPVMHNKDYRDVPDQGEAFKRIPTPQLSQVPLPVLSSEARKHEVVGALLDARRNIALCAFLLDLYAAQWETANAGWGIRHRPDILATLYQIGFERSHPKPDPRPNAFGQRVLEVFDEPWMREHFGPASRLGAGTPL